MVDHSPPKTPTPTPWENLDTALSRLESAILTQRQNDTTNDAGCDTDKDTKQTARLVQQNARLKTALHQTLVTLKTILNA